MAIMIKAILTLNDAEKVLERMLNKLL